MLIVFSTAARRLGAPVLALLTMALATACAGPTYPNCTQDEHCKTKGEYCVDSKCAQCRVDANCPGAAGDVCTACLQGSCGRKADCCTTKLDCGTGKKCDSNKCVAECKSDAECPSGGKCTAQGACESAVVASGAAIDGCSSDSDCGTGLHCQNGMCMNGNGKCQVVAVRFDLNEAALSTTAQKTLVADYKCMKSDKHRDLTIEGHCDERGTDAYNMELGNRRAVAVKAYLKHLDSKFRLKTVSYGKARPLCTTEDSTCFAENRRAEMTTP